MKDIARYINESKRIEEVVTFEVTKVNKMNRDTPRVLEFDPKQRAVTVCKHKKGADVPFLSREMKIVANSILSVELDEKQVRLLRIEFWLTDAKLLRSKKSWKLLFQNQGERERFYRLVSIHMICCTHDPTNYTPKPVKISEEVEKLVGTLPLEDLASELHAVWCDDLVEKGWEHGFEEDRESRVHPSLIPFDELPVEEQKSNIETASSLCGAILGLGYSLKKVQDTPIDGPITSELYALVEYLAENAHDAWAERKLEAGWKYASERSDEDKEHPCLKPYTQLKHHEQDSDRMAAMSIIATLLDFGFEISAHIDSDV